MDNAINEVKNIRFCYRIEAEVGLAQDEKGNNCEAYACLMLKKVKSYEIDSDIYNKLKKGYIKEIAYQINCKEKFITPITLNEYLDNTECDE